ncbi:hypothetical protein P4T04_06395 [Bacillus badius]|uniref:hypothetical protein n=1 Tax=Bacillus badius TaxID=1455 RepID=UPI002E203415|nr:hypothetical protein [Bacillus badius]
MISINDKVSISFDFTGEKGSAHCFIFKHWRIHFTLPSHFSFPEYLRANQQLWDTLSQAYWIEDFTLNLEKASFVVSEDVTGGFDVVEEMEEAICEKTKEISNCLELINYPYQIELTIDGVY